jgi:hypothetical protein
MGFQNWSLRRKFEKNEGASERKTVERIFEVISNCNCYFITFWCLNDGRAVSKTSSKHGIIHDLVSHRKTGPKFFCAHCSYLIHTRTHTHENFSSEDQRSSRKNVSKFTKNQCQLIAQHPFLSVVRSPTCFGQIYWPSSGSDMRRCFNLRHLTWLQLLLCLQLLKLLNEL